MRTQPTIKKLLATALATALFALTSLTALASEPLLPEKWEITDFHVSIFINEDSTLRVTETIQADFTSERHHGIIRSIPYKYSARFGTFKTTKLRLLEAVDSSNDPWDSSVSKDGGYYNIRLQTEDYSYLTGPATFHITYEVERAINFFTEADDNESPEFFPHDELYWNITGNEWVVPIEKATAEIHFPVPLEKTDLKYLCYTGETGSIDQNCEIKYKNATTIEFKTTNSLNPYEGLTAVLALPPETLIQPGVFTTTLWFLADNWPIFMPILILLAMFSLWFWYGRDPKVENDTIIPHYKPPHGLRPTECGIIIDEKLHPRDITATIIDFAIRGFIKIKEIEKKGLLRKKKDYKLTLLKDYEADSFKEPLLEFEKEILDGIFKTTKSGFKEKFKLEPKSEPKIQKEVLLSELKNSFYSHIPKVRKSVMKKLVKDDYFPASPAKTRSKYMGFGFGVAIISFYLGEILYAEFGGLMVFSIIVSALIVIVFGYFMPRKTHKGRETYYVLKGLYEYIKTAEKDRMEFQEKSDIFFEKLLPYAAAFGLVKKWTKTFDGLIKTPPSWYTPSAGDHFTFMYFADRLDHISSQMTSNISSRPGGGGGAWSGGSGFGGGGFSGGGFGGGGGHGI